MQTAKYIPFKISLFNNRIFYVCIFSANGTSREALYCHIYNIYIYMCIPLYAKGLAHQTIARTVDTINKIVIYN